MTLLFAITMILSAALLFVVQPMVAHMVLPALGGSAAVWTSAMLFFQASLLAGYLFAHISARYVPIRIWISLHIALLVGAFFTLPFGLQNLEPDHGSPALWILKTLALIVAPAFILVSATAPTLQAWLARTDHANAKDPYFLYAASNAGSFFGLLSYPFLIEPSFGLAAQNRLWSGLFGVLALLILSTGALTLKRLVSSPDQLQRSPAPVSAHVRIQWLVLAALPSSLMLGLTHFLSTDLAAVPLLWILPLGLYLASFVLAFSPRFPRPPAVLLRLFPAIALVVFGLFWAKPPVIATVVIHLALFFLAAWCLHSRMADLRPDATRVTEYFLLLSVGGMLGGLFNAIIAPLIFTRAIEYWVVLGLACLVFPQPLRLMADPGESLRQDPWQMAAPVVFSASAFWLTYQSGLLDGSMVWAAIPILVAISWGIYARPKTYGLATALVALAATFQLTLTTGEVDAARSFFGAYKVFDRESPGGTVRRFSHGTTAHGAQLLNRPELPVAYHHPEGPVGQAIRALADDHAAPSTIGVLGLGIGAMAAYGDAHRPMEFFEIDPLVEVLARKHFSYLEGCGSNCRVIIGDGRQMLGDVEDSHYQLLFLDAYNSDSVPTHLLTREALQVYLKKTREDGAIVFHVSNRYLNVRELVGALAQDAGLECRAQTFRPSRELRRNEFAMTSSFVILARDPVTLNALDERWGDCPRLDMIWTDDFANLISLL